MPQMKKGGKFVFGWSMINSDLTVQLPEMAVEEYNISSEGKVILISGSKKTGGFCVSRKGLIERSRINGLFNKNPMLMDYKTSEGDFIKYKGRLYCWLTITNEGLLRLTETILNNLSLKERDKLLSIRGSDIAFVMGAKGPLIARGNNFKGEIKVY